MLFSALLDCCAAYAAWGKDILQEKHIGFATAAAGSSGFNMDEKNRNQLYCHQEADLKWMKWMEFGQRLGCHQRADRSFFIGDYQMPVCARCTGVFTGYLMAVLWTPFSKGHETASKAAAAIGSLLMLADWSLQALKIKESTNWRRLFSGIAGGFGIMTFWICFIRIFYVKMRR